MSKPSLVSRGQIDPLPEIQQHLVPAQQHPFPNQPAPFAQI
jgi:hypothetical protein